MQILDSTFKELKKLIVTIEVHYKNQAYYWETVDSRRDSDSVLDSYLGYDKFESYATYDKEVIIASGLTANAVAAKLYGDDPTTIPQIWRSRVLTAQRNHKIKNYKELNNYYRTRMGLPDVEDKQFVYPDPSYFPSGVMKPIHEYTDADLLRMQEDGEIARLQKLFPDKVYLKYLGINKLNVFEMRQANNFEILKITKDVNGALLEKFMNIYSQNREYMMNVIYIADYANQYPYYDQYMAFYLMIMSVQRTIVDLFKNAIEREFYDLYTLRLLFECYSLPLLDEIPLEYQQLLAKNLNKLLYYKSTDKVLFDICDLLGFGSADIYKYYLVKQHIYNEDGSPRFEYKEIINEKGEKELVLDNSRMYEFYFQSVNMKEKDVALAIASKSNKSGYTDVVLDDPYWWYDDEDLIEELYEQEFNYIETKYIHMNVMYRITETMFEYINFIRLSEERKNQTDKIMLSLPKLSTEYVSMFTAVVAMCALLAKKNGMRGEIISSPTKTLSVIGFDFKHDINYIKSIVDDIPDASVRTDIMNYLKRINLDTVTAVNKLFYNVQHLWKLLERKLSDSKTKKEYETYSTLYTALYTAKNVNEAFKLPNGTIAETYMDFLYYHDTRVYNKINEIEDKAQYGELLDHIIYKLQDDLNDLNQLSYLNSSDSSMMNALAKLLNFFKSYTVDLKSFNIIYIMDSRKYNMVKIIDMIKTMTSEYHMSDVIGKKFIDTIMKNMTIFASDEVFQKFEAKIMPSLNLRDDIDMSFRAFMHGVIVYGDMIKMMDTEFLESVIRMDERNIFRNMYRFFMTLMMTDRIPLEVKYSIGTDVDFVDRRVVEDIFSQVSQWTHKDKIEFRDKMDRLFRLIMTDDIKMKFKYYLDVLTEHADTIPINTVEFFDVLVKDKDYNKFVDTINFVYRLMMDDRIMNKHLMKLNSILSFENADLCDKIIDIMSLGVSKEEHDEIAMKLRTNTKSVSLMKDYILSNYKLTIGQLERMTDYLNTKDKIKNVDVVDLEKTIANIRDVMDFVYRLGLRDDIKQRDRAINTTIIDAETDSLIYETADYISGMSKEDEIDYRDKVHFLYSLSHEDAVRMYEDKIKQAVNIILNANLLMYETTTQIVSDKAKDKVNYKDMIEFIYAILPEDIIKLKDIAKVVSEYNKTLDMSIVDIHDLITDVLERDTHKFRDHLDITYSFSMQEGVNMRVRGVNRIDSKYNLSVELDDLGAMTIATTEKDQTEFTDSMKFKYSLSMTEDAPLKVKAINVINIGHDLELTLNDAGIFNVGGIRKDSAKMNDKVIMGYSFSMKESVKVSDKAANMINVSYGTNILLPDVGILESGILSKDSVKLENSARFSYLLNGTTTIKTDDKILTNTDIQQGLVLDIYDHTITGIEDTLKDKTALFKDTIDIHYKYSMEERIKLSEKIASMLIDVRESTLMELYDFSLWDSIITLKENPFKSHIINTLKNIILRDSHSYIGRLITDADISLGEIINTTDITQMHNLLVTDRDKCAIRDTLKIVTEIMD